MLDIEIDEVKSIGNSAFQINIKDEEVSKCVDKYIMAKTVVERLFEKKQVEVKFRGIEKKMEEGALISLWKNGANISGDEFSLYKLSEVFSSFIAGILYHYPALVHFISPHASAYTSWGLDNKDSPLKVMSPARPANKVTHMELTQFDANNYYMAFAAIIAAGMSGIKKQMKLPAPLPVQCDPSLLDEVTKRNQWIRKITINYQDRKENILNSEYGKPIRDLMG